LAKYTCGFQNESLGNSFGGEFFQIVVVHAFNPQTSRASFNRELKEPVGVMRIQRMKSPFAQIGFVILFNNGNPVAEFSNLAVAPGASDNTRAPFLWQIGRVFAHGL
jgi:hypothetical protein